MTKDDIIRMALDSYGAMTGTGSILFTLNGSLVRFAELLEEKVRADEREKSLRLWMLLDDVDTADDIAKSDDAVYRSLCRQAHQKRWAVLTGDEVDATCLKRGGEE